MCRRFDPGPDHSRFFLSLLAGTHFQRYLLFNVPPPIPISDSLVPRLFTASFPGSCLGTHRLAGSACPVLRSVQRIKREAEPREQAVPRQEPGNEPLREYQAIELHPSNAA